MVYIHPKQVKDTIQYINNQKNVDNVIVLFGSCKGAR